MVGINFEKLIQIDHSWTIQNLKTGLFGYSNKYRDLKIRKNTQPRDQQNNPYRLVPSPGIGGNVYFSVLEPHQPVWQSSGWVGKLFEICFRSELLGAGVDQAFSCCGSNRAGNRTF